MMKRIMQKIKLVLIGALIAALERMQQELEEYLTGENEPVPEAAQTGDAGGNSNVSSNGV